MQSAPNVSSLVTLPRSSRNERNTLTPYETPVAMYAGAYIC
jgi:hypothetical protein